MLTGRCGTVGKHKIQREKNYLLRDREENSQNCNFWPSRYGERNRIDAVSGHDKGHKSNI